MKGPIFPGPHQHLVLPFFYYFSYPSEYGVVLICISLLTDILHFPHAYW